MRVLNHGSLVQLVPETPSEHTWLEENTQHEPHNWLGATLCVEPRYAQSIIHAIEEEL